MVSLRNLPRSKRAIPKFTHEVIQLFLSEPAILFRKSEVTRALWELRIPVGEKSAAKALTWLFDYGFIFEPPVPVLTTGTSSIRAGQNGHQLM